jgi:hypothetical protein
MDGLGGKANELRLNDPVSGLEKDLLNVGAALSPRNALGAFGFVGLSLKHFVSYSIDGKAPSKPKSSWKSA